MRIKLANFLSFVIFLSVGCNIASTDEALIPTYVAETAVARQAVTAAVEQALAVALTGSAPPPSQMPTPTATSTPTGTPFPTPTPNPMVEVVVGLAQIRGGPGIAYKVIQNASEGETFEVIGRSEDGRWLVVRLLLEEQGWLFLEQSDGVENVDGLPVLEIPPTPKTDFTITIVNNLSQGQIFFWVFNYQNKAVRIANGASYSIALPPGEYKFNYSTPALGSVSCTKTFKLNRDIYWVPPNSADSFCNSFP